MSISSRPKARLESQQNAAGHTMFCPRCRAFRVHAFEMQGNGAPKLAQRCRTCRSETVYEHVVGGWVPEAVVATLRNFAEARIEREVSEIKSDFEKANAELLEMEERTKRVEKVTIESSESVHTFTRVQRLKAWMSCRRYLMVAAPVAGLLGLIASLGVLAYEGVHVEPFASIAAIYWQQWMDGKLWIVAELIAAAALLAGYVRCRLANRKSDPEIEKPIIVYDEHESEHLLFEMENF